MSSRIIPGVGTLVSSALTDDQVQQIWQNLVLQCLGIVTDPAAEGFDPLAYARVRTEFPEDGQPAWEIEEEVGFVAAFIEPDPYANIRDEGIDANDADSYTKTTIYTRVWRVEMALYGPDSADRIRQIHSCMFLGFVHDTLAASNLYLQTDFPQPRRAPELYAKQWWPRWDFEVQMNEQVTETLVQPSMASVELIIVDATGVILDETIEL
jgi:hypothetical protein